MESVGVAVRQPSKSHIRRHTNRLSGVFLRSPASSPGLTALTGGLRSSQKGSSKYDSTLFLNAVQCVHQTPWSQMDTLREMEPNGPGPIGSICTVTEFN